MRVFLLLITHYYKFVLCYCWTFIVVVLKRRRSRSLLSNCIMNESQSFSFLFFISNRNLGTFSFFSSSNDRKPFFFFAKRNKGILFSTISFRGHQIRIRIIVESEQCWREISHTESLKTQWHESKNGKDNTKWLENKKTKMFFIDFVYFADRTFIIAVRE